MPYVSTGIRNALLPYLREFFQFGCAKINMYAGTVPASADAAVTGTLLCTYTASGSAVKAKQKIRLTPTPGTANGGVWNIVLNGTTFSFTDDGTPSATEICTGLYNLIRAGIGTTSITTPAGAITIPDVAALFTLTDNTGRWTSAAPLENTSTLVPCQEQGRYWILGYHGAPGRLLWTLFEAVAVSPLVVLRSWQGRNGNYERGNRDPTLAAGADSDTGVLSQRTHSGAYHHGEFGPEPYFGVSSQAENTSSFPTTSTLSFPQRKENCAEDPSGRR
jgi:hypothetical protein